MSIVAQIQDGIDLAFTEVGDIAEAITVKRSTAGSYNPQTSAQVEDATQTLSFATTCIPDTVAIEDRGAMLQQGDAIVLIKYKGVAFVPTPDHKAVFRGRTWGIMGVEPMVQGMYQLHLRRPE